MLQYPHFEQISTSYSYHLEAHENVPRPAYLGPVLTEVCGAMERGCRVAICGRSHAGKSSLLNTVTGNLQRNSLLIDVNCMTGSERGFGERVMIVTPQTEGEADVDQKNALSGRVVLGAQNLQRFDFSRSIPSM